MYLDFYQLEAAAGPAPPPPTALRAVYHLITDASYQVRHAAMGGSWILLLNLDGEGELRVGGQQRSLTASQCILFSPDEVFQYWCAAEKWEFWWFEFDAPPTRWAMEPLRLYPFQFKIAQQELCRQCLTALRQEQAALASSFFASLLGLVCANGQELLSGTTDMDFYYRVTRYIRSHLEMVSVSELAWQFDMGERSLRNLFHRHVGISPKQFIQNLRMEQACYLLVHTVKSISEIAPLLGYANPFQFSKAFKERNGCSPLAYRKRQAELTAGSAREARP